MSGRAKNPSWVLLGAMGACALALAFPPAGGADGSPALARLQAENVGLANQARSAELSLYSLDAQLGAAQSRLASLQLETARLRAQRRSLGTEVQVAAHDNRLAEALVAARLRYLYDYGSGPSSLDVLLGSASVGQALTSLDEVDDVSSADTSVLGQLHVARAHLAWLSHALAVRAERLDEATQEIAATVAQLGQAQAARTAYISQLERQRNYNSQRIVVLTAEVQAALQRSLELERQREAAAAAAAAVTVEPSAQGPEFTAVPAVDQAPGAGASPTPAVAQTPAAGAPSPGQSITVTATGYALQGTTATGIPVGYGVAAVDPSLIPLGTHFSVPGYGQVVAADTGGAIVGPRIDLWFPTTAQANAWGVRTVTVVVDG